MIRGMIRSTLRERFVDVNGDRGFVVEAGDGPPLVLLPSMLVVVKSYYGTIRQLARHFRVIAVEMPGAGRASRVSEPWGFCRYASWLEDFLDAMKLDRVTLVGHSNSAAVAVLFAVGWPERVANLVLADPIGAAKRSPARLVAGRMLDAIIELPISAAGWHHVAYNVLFHPRNFFNQVRLSARTDLSQAASRVSAPTLLLWGARDHTTPPHDARHFRRLIQSSVLYVSASGSHDWIVERCAEFASTVRAFVTNGERDSEAEDGWIGRASFPPVSGRSL
jgi:pimeloyl-ACP methyl ester carboxylesterase